MGRLRDSQRSKAYRAEAVLEWAKYTKRYETVPEMEAYVKMVWEHPKIQKAFPKATSWKPPSVKDGRGRSRAGGNHYMITMPMWSRKEWVIIHELAHTITEREHYSKTIAGHGWEWCHTYLELVRILLGPPAHLLLMTSFRKHKVKWKPKAERSRLPSEARSKLLDQLAVARSKIKRKAGNAQGVQAES